MHCTWRRAAYAFVISRSLLLGTRNFSDKSCRGRQSTHFLLGNFFFENRAVCEIMWKYMAAQPNFHRWQYNTAYAHCMLDNSGHKHTLVAPNTNWFSTAKMVKRTRLNATSVRTYTVLLDISCTESLQTAGKIRAVCIAAVAARQVSLLNTNLTFMGIHRSCPLARAKEASELTLVNSPY
jgi:hypothetical protein